MDDFIIIDDEDIEFVWDTVQEQKIIFHPTIAPYGSFNYDLFSEIKRKKSFILFIDRNILISLLKFCENGSLKNKGESQLVGLIMVWAKINKISISAGLAVKERAAQLHSQEVGLIELQKFREADSAFPGQLWLKVAEGQLTEIPRVKYSMTPAPNITVDYSDTGDHYDMALSSLLHIVKLYRDKSITPADKLLDFFQWMYDNLLICEYLLVYAAMLFTEQDGIRAPKNACSNNIDKIVSGCENQAWDISYLTNWSTLYSNTDEYQEEFLFATNDILLKKIFINKHGVEGTNGLFFAIFSKKDYNRIMDYIKEKMKTRVKPDFGDNPKKYFHTLINKEKNKLENSIESSIHE
ncbi:MAG: hypothetical protein IJA80_03545 [Clostridia bacterium]|nr:hypothetical protein [Clostridia bacterium]